MLVVGGVRRCGVLPPFDTGDTFRWEEAKIAQAGTVLRRERR